MNIIHVGLRVAPQAVLAAACIGTTGLAATLTGRVIEDGSKKPLRGAQVVIQTATSKRELATDTNGIFRLDDVARGKVDIIVSKTGYLKSPTVLAHTVDSDLSAAPDIPLFKKEASAAYLVGIADQIVKAANGSVQTAEQLWTTYAELPIHFSKKAELAQAVLKQDERLRTSPPYAQFKGLDPKKLSAIEFDLETIKEQPHVRLAANWDVPDTVVQKVIAAARETMAQADRASFDFAVNKAMAARAPMPMP